MTIATCFSVGTDLATKKSCAAFSKSIMTVGEMSPAVKTGAFALVGSTVAVGVAMTGEQMWIYAVVSSSDESEERQKVEGGEAGEHGRTIGDERDDGCML